MAVESGERNAGVPGALFGSQSSALALRLFASAPPLRAYSSDNTGNSSIPHFCPHHWLRRRPEITVLLVPVDSRPASIITRSARTTLIAQLAGIWIRAAGALSDLVRAARDASQIEVTDNGRAVRISRARAARNPQPAAAAATPAASTVGAGTPRVSRPHADQHELFRYAVLVVKVKRKH
eukprot:IDg9573t1